MTIRRALRLVLIVATFALTARPATATPSAKLVYVRASGAESCPAEADLRKAVADRLGYDPFFAVAPKTVIAQVEKAPKGYRGRVQIVGDDGNPTFFFNDRARLRPSPTNMKHLVTIGLLFFLSASPLLGCSGQQLDGGSNASSSSGQGAVTPDGSATDPGSSGGASIATKPLEGQVVGKPFRVASADLQFDKTNEQWFLHLRSYAVNCGVIEDREAATGPDASLVTIALPEPAAGTFVITYGDSHAATFQSGVYEAGGPEPSTESGKDGTLVFDTWSDVAGTSITGALQLTGNTSNVEGTFTAKICAAR